MKKGVKSVSFVSFVSFGLEQMGEKAEKNMLLITFYS